MSERQLLPRLCCLEKGPNGYGFHLHGEKGKMGQFIRLVEVDSPAEKSGLRAGDRLVEVNGENVEKESHQQVVNRIRAAVSAVRLLVVDPEADEQLQKVGVQCREELIHGLPAGGQEKPEEKSNQEPQEAPREEAKRPDAEEKSHPAEQKELRPRLCQMKKGPSGYGFNLHSDKTKPGQYIRAVDPDSPAESAGLLPQDRIIEVNGQCMVGKQHSDVVAAIKAGGDETKLLVVDVLADEFFKKCKVVPAEQHLTGPLPEPVANGEVEKEDSSEQQPESVSESPASSEPMSVSPSLTETHNESHSREKEEKRNSTPDPLLDLDVPLAVAKERAHQKRTSKKAPQMDWSKKKEMFSNL